MGTAHPSTGKLVGLHSWLCQLSTLRRSVQILNPSWVHFVDPKAPNPRPLLCSMCEIVPIGLWPIAQKPGPSVQTPQAPPICGHAPLCRPKSFGTNSCVLYSSPECFAPTPGPLPLGEAQLPSVQSCPNRLDKLLRTGFCPLHSCPTGRSPNSILLFLILRPLYRRPLGCGRGPPRPSVQLAPPPVGCPLAKLRLAPHVAERREGVRVGGVHAARRAGQPSEPRPAPANLGTRPKKGAEAQRAPASLD